MSPKTSTRRSVLWAAVILGAAIGYRVAARKTAPISLNSFRTAFGPPAMLLAVAILCIFSLYWSAAAKNSKPAVSSESKASRRFHLIVLNAGVLLLIFSFSIPGFRNPVLPASPILQLAGLTIEVAGFALAIWARRTLGANWSGEVRIATGHQLVRTGPYQWIRHPIYTAVLAMYLGILLVSGEVHAVVGLAIIVLAYLRKIRMEETILAAQFGEEFAAWRQETWALAPPIY
jgi:protein-S-isoprenylcysteine O-methyltransferase Ste14